VVYSRDEENDLDLVKLNKVLEAAFKK